MDIEHIGYQVSDPEAAAKWYVEHLGMRLARSFGPPAHAQFVADSAGHVMIEIYNNPKVKVPDYRAIDPLILHLAFEAADVHAERARLIKAGAAPVGDAETTPTGDLIAMLRDPWGFPVQLVRRAKPML
jgi:catechol 2,3-dioxygenase-like lactoylglutathione lyase family enzyme